MNRLAAIFALAAALIAPTLVHSQQASYPSRPIRLVVPNAGGGGPIDAIARVISPRLSALLGQDVFVDNKPGAGQIIGTDIVAKAQPDGYTIGLIGTAHILNPSLHQKLPWDYKKSFTAVARLSAFPLVVVVPGTSPVNSIPEMIAAAKAQGADFKYASVGVGTSPHLAGEMFNTLAGLKMLHVPYNGSPELSALRGETAMYFDSPQIFANYGQPGGKLRPLAVTSAKRSILAPNLPTVAETVPGFEVEAFMGMVAPAGLPPEITQVLSKHMGTILAMPDVRDTLLKLYLPPAYLPPTEFTGFMDTEYAKWGKLIRANNIKVD